MNREPYQRSREFRGAARRRNASMLLTCAAVLLSLSCTDSRQEPEESPPSHAADAAIVSVQPLAVEIESPMGPSRVYQGSALAFRGHARGGAAPYSYRWSFSGASGPVERPDAGEVVFDTPGVYEVTLEVVDGRDAAARETRIVEVIEDTKPIARIDSPRDAWANVREGDRLDFAASVLGGNEPLICEWDLGQGSKPITGMRAENVPFPRSGVFTVTFIARDDNGDVGKDSVVVEVEKNVPVASITSPQSAREIFEGRSVKFAGQAVGGNGPFAFTWDFGGGAANSSAKDPGEVRFGKPGLYTVTFTVTDAQGDAGSAFTAVHVLADGKPVVEILSPEPGTSVLQGTGVEFRARVTGGDEPVKTWWDFQNAAPPAALVNPGEVVFSAPGTYRVTLRSVDVSGDEAEASVQIVVTQDSTPEAFIPGLSEEVLITEKGTILFRGEVSGGNDPFEYLWRFGGAAPDSVEKDAGETAFNNEGTFLVSFTVTDADGDTDTASVRVIVVEDSQPKASLESPESDIEIYEGEAVVFKGSATDGNPPLEFTWDFGGGAKNTDVQNPGEVVFAKAGVFPVTFTVKDDDGDTDTLGRTVAVIKSSWASVSGGWSHSAGLKTDGTLWAWGLNSYGQVGSGNTVSCSTPVMIGGGKDWAKVVVGGAHTLALKANGTLWAWGANGTGQLGNMSRKHAYAPVEIVPGSRWKEIAAGKSHSLGIREDGSLWAWGRNTEGQLGDGTKTPSAAPIRIGSDKDWRCVAAGEAHSIALKQDRTLWVWGSNELGQLGDGGQTGSLIPRRIGPEKAWAAVAAGRWHTLAIQEDGTLWAWGGNIWGQLGDGTRAYKLAPVRIGGDGRWKAVSAGEYHSLALKADGTLWSWGWNAFGQLGSGTTHDRRYPARIGIESDWSFISAGDHHSLAVKGNGTLWGWGYNGYGQVGDGTAEDRGAPILIRPPRKGWQLLGGSKP